MTGNGRSVAVVGAGLMGRWHVHAARRAGARVVAVVDPDLAKARHLAAGAPVYGSVDELLAAGVPAFAHVCSPLPTHVPAAGRLLAAGAHVLCEKPVAPTLAETDALLAAAGAAGRSLWPVHQFGWQRGARRLAGRESSIGEPRRATITISTAGASAGREDELILDVLPHALALLRLWNPSHRVATVDWHVVHPAPGELLASGLHGALPCSISVSTSARPTAARATVAGTRGSADLNFFHGYVVFHAGSVSRVRKIANPLVQSAAELATAAWNLGARALRGESAYPGLRELVRAFYAHAERGGTTPPDLQPEAVHDVYAARERIGTLLRAPR